MSSYDTPDAYRPPEHELPRTRGEALAQLAAAAAFIETEEFDGGNPALLNRIDQIGNLTRDIYEETEVPDMGIVPADRWYDVLRKALSSLEGYLQRWEGHEHHATIDATRTRVIELAQQEIAARERQLSAQRLFQIAEALGLRLTLQDINGIVSRYKALDPKGEPQIQRALTYAFKRYEAAGRGIHALIGPFAELIWGEDAIDRTVPATPLVGYLYAAAEGSPEGNDPDHLAQQYRFGRDHVAALYSQR